MTTLKKTETAPPTPSKEPQPVKKRHRLVLAAVITMVVCAVLVLILQAVPELVARYVIERELEQMGIANEGVGSLHIDLWRREAHLGHMRFGGGPENQGQIGRVSVKYRLVNLLHEQAVIEEMVIDGVDIQITRDTDGEIIVNGIDLSKLMAANKDAEQAPVEETGWGAGLDKFELRNSRIFFTDRARGTLTLDIDRLNLAGFRTFEPDKPGTFELVAKLNEIPLHWRGEARPFADTITVAIDTEIKDVDFAKIETYTGPLGLERRSGVLNAEFTHNITYHPNGRIEVGSDGNIEIRDGDTLYPDLFSLRYDNGTIGLATSFVLDETGNVDLTGSVNLDLESWDIDAKGTKLGAAAASIKNPNFSLTYRADGSLDFAAKPRLTIDRPEVSGAANGKSAKFTLDLSELKIEQASETLSVTLGGTTTLDALDLALADVKEEGGSATGEPVRIGFSKGRLDLAKMLLASKEGSLSLEMQPKLSIDAPNLGGPMQISTNELKVDLADLKIEQSGNDLSMTGAGAIALGATTVTKPIEARSDGLKVDLSSLKVEQAGDSLSVAATGKSVLGSSNLSLTDGSAAGEQLQLGFTQVELNLTRLLLALKEGGLRLDAEPLLSVDTLDLRGPAQATMKRLDVALKTLNLTSEAKNVSVTASGAADVSSLQSLVAGKTGLFPVKVDLGHFNVDLEEGGWGTIGAETRWHSRLGAKVEAFDVSLAEGRVAQAKLREVVLKGGSADQTMDFAADTLVIGGLNLDFNEKLYSTSEADTDTAAKKTKRDQTGAPAARPVIKLGKLAFSDPAKIRFRDTSVTPEVTVDVDVEKLEIDKLDTSDPSQKTDLQLAALVNKFTKLQLSGWSRAMTTSEPSFDLSGGINNAQLAPFSPYAAKAVGLNLEGGKLDLEAKATANAGKLDGNIRLDALDLDFSALSAADAERLSAKVGLPIETAVGLLQDSDGRIELKLPVSGTVADPDIDLSQAIGKAVGGALKSIFPPTAIASLISSGLEGAGTVGLKFKPIPFSPDEAILGDEARQVSDNLAQLLKERPKLRLKVCGRATAADFDAYMASALGEKGTPQSAPTAAPQPEAPATPPAASPAPTEPADSQQFLEKARAYLTELATKRGRDVRQYVVSEHGINPGSLGECRSTFDSTDQGPPRAEVRL